MTCVGIGQQLCGLRLRRTVLPVHSRLCLRDHCPRYVSSRYVCVWVQTWTEEGTTHATLSHAAALENNFTALFLAAPVLSLKTSDKFRILHIMKTVRGAWDPCKRNMLSFVRGGRRSLVLMALIPVIASLQADSMDDDDDDDHGVDRTGVELAFALPAGSDESKPRQSPPAEPLPRHAILHPCLVRVDAYALTPKMPRRQLANKAGGYPMWLDPSEPPSGKALDCPCCKGSLSFVLQYECPLLTVQPRRPSFSIAPGLGA